MSMTWRKISGLRAAIWKGKRYEPVFEKYCLYVFDGPNVSAEQRHTRQLSSLDTSGRMGYFALALPSGSPSRARQTG